MRDAIWYDCPRCGKKACCDGEHYCGKCEEEYQKEREARGEFMTESEMYDYYARLNE